VKLYVEFNEEAPAGGFVAIEEGDMDVPVAIAAIP